MQKKICVKFEDTKIELPAWLVQSMLLNAAELCREEAEAHRDDGSFKKEKEYKQLAEKLEEILHELELF